MKRTVVQQLASRGWHQVNRQEEVLTGWGERRWDMVELKDHQQQEMEGRLQVRLALTHETGQQTRVCIFESSHLEGSYIGDLLYY